MKKKETKTNKFIFLILVGVLLFFLQLVFTNDYSDFFKFISVVLILISICALFFSNLPSDIFISEEEEIKIRSLNSYQKKSPSKLSIPLILTIIILVAFLVNQFLILRNDLFPKPFSISINLLKKNAK